jgi:hypothetical protein
MEAMIRVVAHYTLSGLDDTLCIVERSGVYTEKQKDEKLAKTIAFRDLFRYHVCNTRAISLDNSALGEPNKTPAETPNVVRRVTRAKTMTAEMVREFWERKKAAKSPDNK